MAQGAEVYLTVTDQIQLQGEIPTKGRTQSLEIMPDLSVPSPEASATDPSHETEKNPLDTWLPITESRGGNSHTSTFHLLCSGIGVQALALPVTFTALGWYWGILCLSLAFAWQLYTIWLLVRLHQSASGIRYSRFLHLSRAAFGDRLGKLLAIFPVMYLSGGTCVMLIIAGGGALERFHQTMCAGETSCTAKTLSGAECFLVFSCLAVLLALLFPNLNSLASISAIGAVAAIGYCWLVWILSIRMSRTEGSSLQPPPALPETTGIRGFLAALGTIALAFRGHNLVLEIQGTMPSSPKHPSQEPMWRGVIVSYLLISTCLYPLAIAGFWAYGNMILQAGGSTLTTLTALHGPSLSKYVLGSIYLLISISCLCSFQLYAMPVFDNLELRYAVWRTRQCPRWLRKGLRVFFGCFTFFVAVALPFLGSLAALIGGIAAPLTFSYPCFMWLAVKRPPRQKAEWWANLGLGCLGLVLSAAVVTGAVWNLVKDGLDANFFNPR
ncbi:hypothetical protein NMG60_11019371 [Bertholletia excelsa]